MKFKESHKNLLFIALILACATFLIIQEVEATKPIDCKEPFGVLLLKSSELSQASDVANRINGVVYIPEQNKIIARTEVFECENWYSLIPKV